MIAWLACIATFAPLAAFALLVAARIAGLRWRERALSWLVGVTFAVAVPRRSALVVAMSSRGGSPVVRVARHLVRAGEHQLRVTLLARSP